MDNPKWLIDAERHIDNDEPLLAIETLISHIRAMDNRLDRHSKIHAEFRTRMTNFRAAARGDRLAIESRMNIVEKTIEQFRKLIGALSQSVVTNGTQKSMEIARFGKRIEKLEQIMKFNERRP